MDEHQNHIPDPLVTKPHTPLVSDAAIPVSTAPGSGTRSPAPPRPRKLALNDIYNKPLPIRTFPFPVITLNPISWAHLAAVWLGQALFPPPTEPSIIHTACWDSETRSILVTDEKSMTDLWQQGFYGKGTLSRSEPNWLKRELTRLGVASGRVSEVNTEKRREERTRVKWERARAEQEALEQRRLEESRLLFGADVAAADVGHALSSPPSPASSFDSFALPKWSSSPVSPQQLLALPNSQTELAAQRHTSSEDSAYGTGASMDESSSSGNDEIDPARMKRRKSVRFSPNVQSTVFKHTDPPTPPRAVPSFSLNPPLAEVDEAVLGEARSAPEVHKAQVDPKVENPRVDGSPRVATGAVGSVEATVVNKEHLQLAPEEAFFLVFALGVVRVLDKSTNAVIPTADLLTLFRQHSFFPPQMSQALQPDDPFLIHYAVYHHFRSLGYVPRPGIKFGVDWMLYNRGPVFDHAEYGLQIVPSYSHPYWTAEGRQGPKKSWHWLMGLNRVLSKVYKSLVLVYVEIPPPTIFKESGEPATGLADVLKQYRIREVMLKRWSSNRNRDL